MAESYKETMNLPKTDFPMRGNLAQNEPIRLKKWYEQDIYNQLLEKNKDKEHYVLHDGPPYANGPIHLGHAFNKILKDFVVKSKAMQGYYTPYIPGWDCHGQPIEHMVEEKLGPEKMAKIDTPTLRRLCREWAEKFVDVQRDGFKRLGVLGDWDHPYLTFTPNYESGNVEVFKKMYLDGAIYRGRKPIHWCKHCHTALAEAEIEYGDEMSPSIFVNFKMTSVPDVFANALANSGCECANELYVLIWTTTPWTLPANTAVSLAPAADYCVACANGKAMIFAYDMICDVAEAAGWQDVKVLCNDGFAAYDLESRKCVGGQAGGQAGEQAGEQSGEQDGKSTATPILVKGKDLEGFEYICPIRQDIKGKIIWGDHVTLDSGTGAVHTAPGHGVDDYLVGQRFGVATLMPVDDNGVLTEEAGRFEGLDVDEANPKIIQWLDQQGVLVSKLDINHSYPHCWRCHEPVIFRATDQWFVSMDKTGLRQKAAQAINNDVNFVPQWAKNRIGSMVEDRPDWCISRQRSWGVPIPVFKCAKCGQTIATEQTFDSVIQLFETKGADAWYTMKPEEYLPAGTHCETCGCTEVVPETDILDVWWESGVSHTSVCKHREAEGLHFPADMYLEGSDQHRGWFQSSLLTSLGAYDVPPYKEVMHCGFIVDGEGKKQSKSKGNVIAPDAVMNKFGADVLRLWVSSVDHSQDVGIDNEILQRVTDAYRRIRNSFRFLLGSLYDFSASKAVKNWDELLPVDKWMMGRTYQVLQEVTDSYNQYNFHNIYRCVYNFINNDLSAVYMDVTKDRMYSDAADSIQRRSAQTVLCNVLEVMVRTLAPILSFTCDEVWEHYPDGLRADANRGQNVVLAGWPSIDDFVPAVSADTLNSGVDEFAVALDIRDEVTKALEAERGAGNINKSQEAKVAITVPGSMKDAVESLGTSIFEELFIVSAVDFEFDQDAEEIAVKIGNADGQKCPRCWNYRQLNSDGLCDRCADIVG